jgi:hypothetical protein
MTKEYISTPDLEQHIKDLMKQGKESSLRGWTIEDILKDVLENWGVPARDYAYKYIVDNIQLTKELYACYQERKELTAQVEYLKQTMQGIENQLELFSVDKLNQ